MSASPRRKIRVGDRVTGSQGLVTIPEVNRMLVEARSARPTCIASGRDRPRRFGSRRFPTLRLTGKVARVGTLARSSADRPFDDKRFDLVVELDPTGAELRPEMTARADILRRRARQRAAGARQRRLRATAAARRASSSRATGVETRDRASSANRTTSTVEVVAGLGEGDRVLLPTAPAAPSPRRRRQRPTRSAASQAARSRAVAGAPCNLASSRAVPARSRPKRSAATSCARRSACWASCSVSRP